MRLPASFIPWLLGPLLASPPVWPQPAARPLAFIQASLIDGTSSSVLPNAVVLVRQGRIERILGPDAPLPEGAEIIDLRGYYLLPGLIDAHAHLGGLEDARRALEAGVTTVRSASVGSFRDVVLREMVRRGVLAGPEVLASGLFVQPDLGESILSDAELMTLHGGVQTPEELRHLVRVLLDHGVDWVKTRANERAGILNQDPRRQVYSEAQLRVVVEEATRRGVPVMCHAHSDAGIRAAVEAGVRSIEHGSFISRETLALMKEKGTFLVPTYSEMFDLTEPGGEYDHPILKTRGLHIVPRLARTIQRAHRMGVPVVAGGDTGYEAAEVSRLGMELTEFVKLGFSPLEALQAATSRSAELLGIHDRTGAVRPDLEADLIVVGDNPLENMWALNDVLLVMSNGRVAVNHLDLERGPSGR